nr:exopolysaccharide biosynthesis polyprenyl glycosylphosphotransferase [Lachnospiraceae bacterium]
MFAGYSVISFSLQNMDYRRLMIKRAFDIIGSIVGIIITIIIYPFVALAIKAESKGPVIFKQERIGKNGRRFMMYKFRSMYQDAEKRLEDLKDKNEVQGLMFKMEDDPRITKVGRFIRKTSIDELPQFFNILKGDMSLVGTRPPTVAEFEQYNAHYRRRLCITPGLTGMWQVSGRSDIKDFDEVVKLDLKYIDEWSLRLDVKLLLQTVGAVLSHKGSK